MLWIVVALCLILFGAGLGVIGLSLNMLGYAIVGGIMVLAGIIQLVSIRRNSRYRGAMRPLNKCPNAELFAGPETIQDSRTRSHEVLRSVRARTVNIAVKVRDPDQVAECALRSHRNGSDRTVRDDVSAVSAPASS